MLQKGDQHSMAKKFNNLSKNREKLLSEQEKLQQQVIDLQKQVYRLQIEKDALEKAAEIDVYKRQTFNSAWIIFYKKRNICSNCFSYCNKFFIT